MLNLELEVEQLTRQRAALLQEQEQARATNEHNQQQMRERIQLHEARVRQLEAQQLESLQESASLLQSIEEQRLERLRRRQVYKLSALTVEGVRRFNPRVLNQAFELRLDYSRAK